MLYAEEEVFDEKNTNCNLIFEEFAKLDDETNSRITNDLDNLKREVCDVVKHCLDKFYKNKSITSKEEFESLARQFSYEFRRDIKQSYLKKHDSYKDIQVSQESKRKIIDKIVLYFNIQEHVKKTLEKLPSSREFKSQYEKLSRDFYNKVRDSNYAFQHNSIGGMAVTDDFLSQITNMLRFQCLTNTNY